MRRESRERATQSRRSARSHAAIRSPGIPAVVEVMFFFRRAFAPKNRIAMGKMPETPHDVAMMFGMREIVGSNAPRQRNRSLLVGEVLRVGKRQHEKLLQLTR